MQISQKCTSVPSLLSLPPMKNKLKKKQVNSKVLLSSIGNCIQYPLNHNGREKNQGTRGVTPSRHVN